MESAVTTAPRLGLSLVSSCRKCRSSVTWVVVDARFPWRGEGRKGEARAIQRPGPTYVLSVEGLAVKAGNGRDLVEQDVDLVNGHQHWRAGAGPGGGAVCVRGVVCRGPLRRRGPRRCTYAVEDASALRVTPRTSAAFMSSSEANASSCAGTRFDGGSRLRHAARGGLRVWPSCRERKKRARARARLGGVRL